MNLPPAWILAQSAYHYSPFFGPIPFWSNSAWPWLLLPLVIGVAVVYKAIRVEKLRRLPGAAASITLWIVVGMAVAAFALAALVNIMQRV